MKKIRTMLIIVGMVFIGMSSSNSKAASNSKQAETVANATCYWVITYGGICRYYQGTTCLWCWPTAEEQK